MIASTSISSIIVKAADDRGRRRTTLGARLALARFPEALRTPDHPPCPPFARGGKEMTPVPIFPPLRRGGRGGAIGSARASRSETALIRVVIDRLSVGAMAQ